MSVTSKLHSTTIDMEEKFCSSSGSVAWIGRLDRTLDALHVRSAQ